MNFSSLPIIYLTFIISKNYIKWTYWETLNMIYALLWALSDESGLYILIKTTACMLL